MLKSSVFSKTFFSLPTLASPQWRNLSQRGFRSFHSYRGPLRQGQRFNQYQRFNNQQSGGRLPLRNLLYRWSQQPTFFYQVGGLGLAGGTVYVYNLEEVPVSGRRRFNVISDDQITQLGLQQCQEILEQYRNQILPDYDPRSQMVHRVLARLLPSSGLTDTHGWEVHVIDSPEANAFVLPGGKVFVFSGILPICKDENGVAAVLGHEIAHNVARHMSEKLSQSYILGIAAMIFQQLFGLPDFASNMLLTLAFERPGSRTQESEADYIGLMMMAQSCYDPESAAKLWAEMEKSERDHPQPPQMLSTHPSHHNRQEKIREWLPKAQAKFDESQCSHTVQQLSSFRDRVTGRFYGPSVEM